MVFKSAIDTWYYVMIAVTAIILAVALVGLLKSGAIAGMVIVLLAAVLSLGLPIWLMLTTNYTVRTDVLDVRSGPFRWRIPRSEIYSIQPSRSLLSAPALSLNRLEIQYGQSKTILVSPADPEAFREAIGV
ncbi:PH domain-containing protein [Halomicronema sp. CCY15110]|uniref:PH domain-containing protein n=1 Tax=Halomicronema sp. CCY15110 TaxID=2767773 RepID=UPI00194EF3D7|nr:PH domain-containing protein [Halomicronema sp. CCY15110]